MEEIDSHTLQLIDRLEKFEVEEAQRPQQRQHFDSYFQYVLSVLGFTVGYGSFWRFPYLVYENGGGVFLIPYVIAMLVFGIPLLYLEAAVGQMHQQTIPCIYEKINKGLKMFGYFVIFIAFGIAVYYNILLTYSYRYVFTSFLDPLPFLNEAPADNTYFNQQVLNRSNSIDEFGSINWMLAGLFLLSLYVCYQAIKRGVKTSGKILIFTVILPYVLFTILAIRGLFLQGSDLGIKYMFKPDWSKLAAPRIWMDALVQVFYQMSIASAGVMNYSGKKPKNEPFMSILYIIPIGLLICGVLSGLIIFMYVGHFCFERGLEISQLTLHGPDLAFNILPKAIGILPWPNLWLFIFCIVLVLLGIDTMFGFLESVADSLQQEYKDEDMVVLGIEISHQWIKPLSVFAIAISLPFLCSSAGIYYLEFFDTFVVDIGLPFGALLEIFVFVYLFEFQRLEEEVLYHTNSKTPRFIRAILTSKFLVVSLIGFLVFGIFRQLALITRYPFSFYLFGWTISLYPVLLGTVYWLRHRTNEWYFEFKALKARDTQF